MRSSGTSWISSFNVLLFVIFARYSFEEAAGKKMKTREKWLFFFPCPRFTAFSFLLFLSRQKSAIVVFGLKSFSSSVMGHFTSPSRFLGSTGEKKHFVKLMRSEWDDVLLLDRNCFSRTDRYELRETHFGDSLIKRIRSTYARQEAWTTDKGLFVWTAKTTL